MPPLAVTDAVPVLPALQAGLVLVADALTVGGALRLTLAIAVQPLTSLTVTE